MPNLIDPPDFLISSTTQTGKLDSSQGFPDYYTILRITQNASNTEIKAAYHRTLLLHHPDKQQLLQTLSTNGASLSHHEKLEIALIQEAFNVLSNSESRSRYDGELKQRSYTHGPRPANVISLDEWTSTNESEVDGDEGPWIYPCRCGGQYKLDVESMERDEHLIGCDSCSEVVWAGYELESNDDE